MAKSLYNKGTRERLAMTLGLFDWPFFISLFAAQLAAACAGRLPVAYARPEELPGWASTKPGSRLLLWISIPFMFGDVILLCYGFLVLPWYTVVICIIAAFFAVMLFWNFFLSNIVSRCVLFVFILFSYPIALLTAARYFAYFVKEHVISPNLAAIRKRLTALYTFPPSNRHPKILHQIVVEIKIQRTSRRGRPLRHAILQLPSHTTPVHA